ncbi:hypothetical protein FUAX_48110 (plasmid) [Fulvitalea axinellae]|uniref:Uncharacterized protein n=1 Tax=Fulvitalea axinellae TaxID=1182444 RepID=A0AAU9DD35_9BACT|nr:hypothetical protein FUAX_48110 [Fulvitalea axinellae]
MLKFLLLVTLGGIAYYLYLKNKKDKGLEPSSGITDAQVKTLLRISGNKLTAETLAKKTRTEVAEAEEKLKAEYMEGKLEIDEEDGVVFYYKK